MFTGFNALGFDAIGEAPEERWAVGGSSDWLLDWEVRIYAATHEYISSPSDSPPDQAYLGTLDRQRAFRVDRSILGDGRIGEQVTIGLGEVSLSNLEGDYDFLARDHTPLGQRIEIWAFDRRRPKARGKLLLSGYMVDQQPNRNEITFTLRDAGHKLDVVASPNIYAGTGDTEGGDDLKGKSKPRAFGWLLEWSAPLVIPSSLAYQLNDGPINAVTAAYIRGVAQTFAGNYASVALMNAASLSVGQYATCLAAGWGRIAVASGAEIGQVTWDLQGDKAGGVFVETSADIVRRLFGVTEVLDPADLSETSFEALNASQPAAIGYGIPVGDTQTVAAAVARIMAGIGGWCGAKRNGKFEVRRFEAPAGVPNGYYTKATISEVSLAQMPSELSPPPWRVQVGWARIWTPGQTNLAGSVSQTRLSYLAQEVRFASVEDSRIKSDFPPGHELIEADSFFRDEADALDEATRKLALYGTSRSLYAVKLAQPMFVHELGHVVNVQFNNRFNLDEGKTMRIVKLSESSAEGVELTGFV